MFDNEDDFSFCDDFEDDDLSKLKVKPTDESSFRKMIEDNHDQQTKTVGDRVKVIDSSRLVNSDTNHFVTDDFEEMILCDYESIVIEDKIKHRSTVVTMIGDFSMDLMIGDFSMDLDLKIWNKSLNKTYRTTSKYVKLIQ